METVLDILIQYVEDRFDMSQDGPLELRDKIKWLKNKEKEQMEACFHNGYVEGVNQQLGLSRKYTVFDDYYNTIFGHKPSFKEKASDALFKNKNN